jgi:aarF domain-containing kinase
MSLPPPPGDASDGDADDLSTSRGARARALGALGVELAATWLRAGARRLYGEPDDRVWPEAHRAGAASIIRSLGRLRGAATKLGQALSYTPGVLPDEYIDAMVALTDDLPAMSYGLVKAQIRDELGKAPLDLFATFDRAPVAAASLGQVHRATLHDGTTVAVKVQYPAIDETMRADLANLEACVPFLERVARRGDLRDAVAEVRERLTEELDYRLEADHYDRFRAAFDGDAIHIPAVHRPLSTERVLTLGFVEGVPIREYLEGEPPQEDRNRLTRSLIRFAWTSLYEHRMIQADPNPGNYLRCDDGRLGVVDFGCVKRLAPAFGDRMRSLVRAAAYATDRALEDELAAAGMLGPDAGPDHRANVRRMMRLWTRSGVAPEFDFGDRAYLDELVTLQQAAFRDPAVRLDPAWIFLGRTFVGQTYLLFKLGARGSFRDLFEASLGPA